MLRVVPSSQVRPYTPRVGESFDVGRGGTKKGDIARICKRGYQGKSAFLLDWFEVTGM